MATLDTVVIKITGDSKDIDKTINQLEKLGKVDRRNADSFKKTSTENQKSIKKTTTAVGGLEKQLNSLGAVLVGAFAIQQVAQLGKKIFDLTVQLEEAQADVRKTTGLTAESVKSLTKELQKIDTRSSVFELLNLATAAGRLGVAGKDLVGFVTQVDKAFVALGDDLGGTAESIATDLGKIAGVFGIEEQVGIAEALNKVGSTVNELAANTKAGAAGILDFTKRLAGVAPAAGISLPNIAAIGALLEEFGQSAEVGATALNQLLPKIGSDLPKFAKLAGISIKEFSTLLREDANEALLQLFEGVKNTGGGVEGLAKLLKDFGIDGARASGIIGVLTAQTGRLREIQELANKAFEEGTSLTDEFNIKNQTLGASADKLSNSINGLLLSIGTSGAGGLQAAINDIAVGIGSLSNETSIVEEEFSVFGTIINAIRINLLLLLLPFREAFKLFVLLGKNLVEKFSPAIEKVGDFFEKTIIPVFITFRKVIFDTVKALFAFGETLLSKVGININLSAKAVALFNEIMGGTAEVTKEGAAGAKELSDSVDVVTESTKKAGSAIDELNKLISALKKELINQALAGDISAETMKAYKDAIRQASDAQVELRIALTDTLPFLKAQDLELEKIGKASQTAGDLIGDFKKIQQDEIEETLNKRLDAIGQAAEAEQSLSRIISQINTNRLIDIDNQETAQLRALKSQGLGEEELAERQLDIQQKADEERAKILTKQAKADKIAALFSAGINAAVAITKALATTANPIFAAFIAGLALVEVAVIAAEPIPTFHEGKKADLKPGEIYAKILESESVIPPEQSKKYKGPIDAMIDKRFESYVMKEYMLPMMRKMSKGNSPTPYDDSLSRSNQKQQMKLTAETNYLIRSITHTLEPSNRRRTWN